MIWTAILKLTWFIFIQGPLNIIAAFTKVLEYLTGGIITDLLFGSNKDFSWNNIPMQFWWFAIIALCLFALIFTIQMIILLFKEAIETKTKFVIAIQNGVKAFSFMFLIPIFFFLANFIIQNIANTIINNFGQGSNLAEYLYHVGDPNWDGTPDGVKPGFAAPDGGTLNKYNMIAQIFGTWFMLFAIFVIGIILVQKVIELFFLFVISPIVMIVMVVDDGKAAFLWKDMVGAKFLASTATLIGYYIFMAVTQKILASDLSSLEGWKWAKQLFIILFISGGGLATLAFSDIAATFLGESVGIREGRASLKSTMAGGMMAMGAGRTVGQALGFMKSKRAQKNQGLLNSQGINSMSNDVSVKGVNTTNFRNTASGMASRSGIIGLAGLGLGALGTAIGASTATLKNSYRNKKEFVDAVTFDVKANKTKLLKTKAVALTTVAAPFTLAKGGVKGVGKAAKTAGKSIVDASYGQAKNKHKNLDDKFKKSWNPSQEKTKSKDETKK